MANFEAPPPQPAKAGGKEAAPKPSGQKTEFRRSYFVKETAPGASEWVSFSPELHKNYKQFLSEYMTHLEGMQDKPDPANPGRTLFDSLLSNPEHAYKKTMFDRLTSEVTDDNHNPLGRKVEDAKIDKFLSEPQGWEQAKLLRNQHALEAMKYLGQSGRNAPGGEVTSVQDSNMYPNSLNVRGRLRDWANADLDRHRVLGALDRGLTMFRGELIDRGARFINRRVNGIINNANLNLTPNYSGYGGRLEFRDSAAMQTLAADVTQRPYLDAMFKGLDSKLIKRNIDTSFAAEKQFYKELGIPEAKLNLLPEQRLLVAGGDPLQTGLKIDAEVEERYVALGIPAGAPREQSIRGYEQARREVIANREKALLKVEMSRKDKENQIEKLDQKITDRTGPDGRIYKARMEPITTREAPITENNETLKGERTTLEQYVDKVTKQREAQRKAEYDAQTAATAALTGLRNPAGGGGAFADAPTALAALYSMLDQPGSIGIDGRTIGSIHQRQIDAQTLHDTPAPGYNAITNPRLPDQETPTEYSNRLRTYNETREVEYTRTMDRIKEDTKLIKDKIAALENAITPPATPLSPELSEADPNVKDVAKTIAALRADFNTVTGIDAQLAPLGLATMGLSETHLLSQPIDVLMQRINFANSHLPTVGWPAGENNNEENRLRLVHAITEARARQLNPSIIPVPGSMSQQILDLGISENQIRTLTPNELLSAVNDRLRQARRPRLTYSPRTINSLRDISQQAENGVTARMQAYQDQIADSQPALTALAADKKRVERELTVEIEQISVVKAVLEKRSKVGVEAGRIMVNTPQFVDVVRATAADNTLTPTEIAAGAERGYYQFLNVLTGYQDKPDRQKAFTDAQTRLNPAQLATLLNESLELGLTPRRLASPNAFRETLNRIGNGIQTANTIGSLELTNALRGIGQRLYEEAAALP